MGEYNIEYSTLMRSIKKTIIIVAVLSIILFLAVRVLKRINNVCVVVVAKYG